MFKIFRRKAKPVLATHDTRPVDLRPILDRALGRQGPDAVSPEVRRLLELVGTGRAGNRPE
jgi:hypothetical protein